MKKLLLVLLLLLLAGLPLVVPVQGQSAGFVIERADSTNTIGLGGSTTLNGLVNNVVSRFVIEFANAKRTISITAPPAGLSSLLQQTAPRFVIEYANTKKTYPVTSPPAGLVTLLQQAAPRFVIEYANVKRVIAVMYPAALVNDADPPQVTNQTAHSSGVNRVAIQMAVNEYATCTLVYGISPGIYPHSDVDELFNFNHPYVLTGFPNGVTLYYRFIMTDRSGNTSTSEEFSYNTPVLITVPFIKR